MAIIKCKNCGRMIRESDRRCLYCNVLNADYIETNSVSASSLGETRRWDPSAIESATPLSRGSIVDKIVDKNHVEVISPTKKNNNPVLKTIKIILLIIGSIIALILFNIIANDIVYSIDYNTSPHSGYYIDGENLYYFDSFVENDEGEWVSRWWACEWNQDKTDCDWSIYEEGDNLGFILSFGPSDSMWLIAAEESLGVPCDVFDIELNKYFLDKGGRVEPQTGYYYCNNQIYFYLKADWEIEKQYTGWYAYQESNQRWCFHAKYDFKGVLDELLYYYPDRYYIGESDASWRTTNVELPVSFLETEWYTTAQAIEKVRG